MIRRTPPSRKAAEERNYVKKLFYAAITLKACRYKPYDEPMIAPLFLNYPPNSEYLVVLDVKKEVDSQKSHKNYHINIIEYIIEYHKEYPRNKSF